MEKVRHCITKEYKNISWCTSLILKDLKGCAKLELINNHKTIIFTLQITESDKFMDKNKLIRNFYYLGKRLVNASSAFIKELFKPISFLKGDDFEECLRRKVFTKDKYDLVMKTHDYNKNHKDYIESSFYPDYMFRDKINQQEFFVEAKYREKEYQGKIKWCNPSQFRRYKYFNREDKVLIAIGFGGRPKNPKHIFIVPLEDIKYTDLYLSFLMKYEFKVDRKNLLDNLLDNLYSYSR